MKRRHGFTLVELLVSMALIIFIMAILSQCFVAALGTFRNLKAQGDMAEKLRSTMQILQNDLAADHFDGSRKLSDMSFWSNGPPQQGFFQLYQGPPANLAGTWQGTSQVAMAQVFQGAPQLGSFQEGADLSTIGSYRSVNHALAFTLKLRGNNMGDFMTASAAGSGNVWTPLGAPVVPNLPGPGLGIGAIGSTVSPLPSFGPPESRYQSVTPVASVTGYNYQWAAVAWFLQPQVNPTTGLQDTTATDATSVSPAVPLFTLYRRQALLVPDNNLVALSTTPIGGVPSTLINNFAEMSCLPDPAKGSTVIYFNNPNDITMPSNRYWGGNLLGGVSQLPFPLPSTLPAYIPPDMPPYLPIPATAPGLLRGSDIQLNDVVSFDVRMMVLVGGTLVTSVTSPLSDPFVTLWQPPFNVLNTVPSVPGMPPNMNNGNPAYYPANAAGPMVFDTWSSNNSWATINPLFNYSTWITAGALTSIPFWNPTPLPGSVIGSGPIIKAIQITIRIWDFKTNQTRQVTIVQAM